MNCKEQDINLYNICLSKLRKVNNYLERNNKDYKYCIHYIQNISDAYYLKCVDSSNKSLFVRSFTYCDRLLDYLSGMCNMIDEVEQ